MIDSILKIARECGACEVGFTQAAPIAEEQNSRFDRWLELGLNGDLAYMANHSEIRRDPRLLLEGAQTIICLAFPYSQPKLTLPTEPFPPQHCAEGASPKIQQNQSILQNSKFKISISSYALGEDYHLALRRRLEPLTNYLATLGHQSRICIDSAPIHERYLAELAGLGKIGRNGALINPRHGSKLFLAEILTTWTPASWSPGAPSPGSNLKTVPESNFQSVPETNFKTVPEGNFNPAPETNFNSPCLDCTRCIDACPTGAITHDGIDARLCLSALTIEHRGDFSEQQKSLLREKSRGAIFGCDICRDVCPYNQQPTNALPEFRPSEAIQALTTASLDTMTGGEFKRKFAGSPLFRAGLKGLRRNLSALEQKTQPL